MGEKDLIRGVINLDFGVKYYFVYKNELLMVIYFV